eukprot:Nitzschia sp. Nitz4//scaffold52_size167869//56335//57796//NITZ4_002270-RA/size167869-snap-gene-0.223-mRNA-1//-1//CDS//3329554017//3451//frame0
MVGLYGREERRAVLAAARARNGAKASSSQPRSAVTAKSAPAPAQAILRSFSNSGTTEDRHDEEASRTPMSTTSIRDRAGTSRPRSFRRNRSQSRERPQSMTESVADTKSLFGPGDKRQKKILYRSFADEPTSVLEIVVEDPPFPAQEDHVVVKVSASTVSYSDCLIRRGVCFNVINPTDLPATPGMDVVGNIVAVGREVTNFKAGDRVAALVRTGGNARYVSVPATSLVEVPRSCDAAEAVCMVSTYMTAYQALRLVTKDNFTLNGKRVLITGGIEPVGQALIQLCFRAGADEIYATAPNHRHRYVKTVLGAHPLPVDPKLWLDSIEGSLDIVFDGTCYDSLESPTASLRSDGALICVGMSALLNREKSGVFGAPISAWYAKLKGQLMFNTKSYEVWDSFLENKDAYKLDLEILFHLLKKRFIKPHIAKRIALSEVAGAHASLEKENARGEIVCLPWKRIGK